MNRRSVVAVLGYLAAVHVLAYAGRGLLKSAPQTGWSASVVAEAPPLARFDAGWYRSIAERGYFWDRSAGVGSVAFFPLYPFLLRVVSLSGLPLFWSGLLVSHVFFLISVALLYRLQLLRAGPFEAAASVLALIAFPWAFFLLAPYSESLFLALALGAWLFAIRGRWSIVAVLGLLAGMTRLFGVALAPALLVIASRSESRSHEQPARPRLVPFLAALSPVIGCAGFFAWLGFRFSDPGIFLSAERRGWGRRPGWSGLWESVQAIPEHVRQRGWLHLGAAVDLLVVLLLSATVAHALRTHGLDEACYVGVGVVLIALGGQLASSGRYALVLFPVFGFLSTFSRRRFIWPAILLGSSLLQAYLIVRFVNNLWVA